MPSNDETRPLSVRATSAQEKAWTLAADAAGLSRHQWMRLVCDLASGNSELLRQAQRAMRTLQAMQKAYGTD